MPRKERSDKQLRKDNSRVYPRKCETCDYISNNPSMFHYHKKTHYSVEGKLCDHGCGNPAKFVKTNGKYTCSENSQHCPQYLAEHAERIRQQWVGDDRRREDTIVSLRSRLHNEENARKISATRRAKTGLLTEEVRTSFRKYARACRSLSQLWAKDNGYKLGPQTFHVDHIYSVLDGFKNEIAPAIISHPANLRILEAKKNTSKGPKSEITLQELLERTGNDNS